MKRINEKEAAAAFVAKLSDGYYAYDRSQNTEVDHCNEQEQRDTDAVKSFVKSRLFDSLIVGNLPFAKSVMTIM